MPAIPSEEEWLEQTAKAQEEAQKLEAAAAAVEESWPSDAPTHPIPQLQGPFEESIAESTNEAQSDWQVDLDAQTRRDQVLTAPRYERLCGRRWKQRPSERYHPLWKLVAQISFGLHLLSKGLAKSEAAVIKILQVHVAELDGYIENTTDDIFLAFSDIEERLNHLRLPLGNLEVFNDMLADRVFRQTVILDHERIDHIIHRTAMAMDDSVKDIEKGIQSVRILGFYLKELRVEGNGKPQSLDAVYGAMLGNVDGWKRECKRLRHKAYNLSISLGTLNQVALEIHQLAEAAAVNSRKSMASGRPASRGHSHRKHMPHTPDRASIISQKPLPQLQGEPASYTAEARTISIIAGRSPVTVVKHKPSRQSLAPQRRGSAPGLGPQQKPPLKKGKDSSSNTDRYYANVPSNPIKSPRRSVTAPDLSISKPKSSAPSERTIKKRPTTSSSKATELNTISEKEPTKPFSKFGSKLNNRFQRTTSKILSSAKGTIKRQTRSRSSQRGTFNPMERSWNETNSRDQQMGWSQEPKDIPDPNATASRKDSAPEFPHLIYMSFLDDQTLSDEEEEEETSVQEDNPGKEQDNETGHESQITALPIMNDSAKRSNDQSDQDDDVAAEVASTYSTKNRRFRAKNLHVPPLPKPKFSAPLNSGANNGHVIYQNRRLRQRPSVFSFISSKKGSEAASNSPVVKSRQESSKSEPQTRPGSASASSHLHGQTEPVPAFNSSWYTPRTIPSENIETPPISPTTSSNPMASSLSVAAGEKKAPETDETNTSGSISGVDPKPPAPNFYQQERGKTGSSTTLGSEKPHGGLRLFPRTPEPPVIRKYASMSSLRNISTPETISDSTRPPKSRGVINYCPG